MAAVASEAVGSSQPGATTLPGAASFTAVLAAPASSTEVAGADVEAAARSTEAESNNMEKLADGSSLMKPCSE